jgi:hypothetical protein
VSRDVPEQRILEESMRLPSDGAVTGWAGCRLARAAYFDGTDPDGVELPVPLLVPRTSRLRSLPTSSVSREPFAPNEVRAVLGIRTAMPVRALFDAMRAAKDPREAVVAMDMMAAAVQVSILEMRRYLGPRRSWRRAQQVGWALDLASERSLSPGEARMRLVWVLDAQLPFPLVNQPLWDERGRLLGVADIFDPTAGVVGEYDGGTHLRMGRRTKDAAKEDLCRRNGLEFFRVTPVDMHDTGKVVERMRTTRARAPYLQGRRGTWTMQAPPWSRLTETAEELLAHREWLREIRVEESRSARSSASAS